jgi:hypothetical protein
MSKDTQTTSKEVNMHKRIAMGEKVTGMKKGGEVKMAEMAKMKPMKKDGKKK